MDVHHILPLGTGVVDRLMYKWEAPRLVAHATFGLDVHFLEIE
jgi:hypothetical protein